MWVCPADRRPVALLPEIEEVFEFGLPVFALFFRHRREAEELQLLVMPEGIDGVGRDTKQAHQVRRVLVELPVPQQHHGQIPVVVEVFQSHHRSLLFCFVGIGTGGMLLFYPHKGEMQSHYHFSPDLQGTRQDREKTSRMLPQ